MSILQFLCCDECNREQEISDRADPGRGYLESVSVDAAVVRFGWERRGKRMICADCVEEGR